MSQIDKLYSGIPSREREREAEDSAEGEYSGRRGLDYTGINYVSLWGYVFLLISVI